MRVSAARAGSLPGNRPATLYVVAVRVELFFVCRCSWTPAMSREWDFRSWSIEVCSSFAVAPEFFRSSSATAG